MHFARERPSAQQSSSIKKGASRWLVVLNVRPSQWGMDGVACRFWRHDGSETETISSAPFVVINSEALVANQRLRRSGAGADTRIWIHFGNADSNGLTRSEISRRWSEAVREKAMLGPLEHCEVNPFSMTSRMSWDCVLQSLATAVQNNQRQGVKDNIEKLSIAWKAASGFYATRGLSRLADAASGLYLKTMAARALDAPKQAECWTAAMNEWRLTGAELLTPSPIAAIPTEGPLSTDESIASLQGATAAYEWLRTLTPATPLPDKVTSRHLVCFEKLLAVLNQHYRA